MYMKLNEKLIKKLRNGEIAVENNGTLEQLTEVLKAAFNEDKRTILGTNRFYFLMDSLHMDNWAASDSTTLPTISVTDFYESEPFTGWAKDDKFEKFMFYYKDDVQKFGFNTFGSWLEGGNVNYSEDKNNRPATTEEIEKHLIQEAKRRGYKSGNYKCLQLPSYTHDVGCGFYYNEEENKLHNGRKGFATNVVFNDGQWAEIVEEPKPNPINYLVDDMKYSFNYQELKKKYQAVVAYSDEVFMDNLPEIAHLACIISYFKGLSNNATIGDKGIIHELIHLMTDKYEPTNDLQEIRNSFNDKIKLS